jgi:hypothetical protein
MAAASDRGKDYVPHTHSNESLMSGFMKRTNLAKDDSILPWRATVVMECGYGQGVLL